MCVAKEIDRALLEDASNNCFWRASGCQEPVGKGWLRGTGAAVDVI
jgi:hypothetical protein